MTISYMPLFIPVGPEVLVIVLIAILLFGAQRIPELAHETGRSLGEFQKAKQQSEREVETLREELDTEADENTGTSSSASDNKSSLD